MAPSPGFRSVLEAIERNRRDCPLHRGRPGRNHRKRHTQTSTGAGLPSDTSSAAFSGTYVLNTDGTGMMTLTIGGFHFVMDDNGNEIRLLRIRRPPPVLRAAKVVRLRHWQMEMYPGTCGNPSAECSGLFTPVPSPPQFPFGIPLEVD